MENGEYPISPIIKDFSDYVNYGLTKREYFAGNNTMAAIEYFNYAKPKDILKFLGIEENIVYVPEIHYVKAISKMQILLADELLKQLDNG